MNLKTISALACMSALAFAGCQDKVVDNPNFTVSPCNDAALRVTNANTAGIAVFQKLTQQEDGNVFMSPWSISQAFGMLSAGAKGETLQQLKDALGVQGDLTDFYTSQNANYADSVKVANSLWLNKNDKFLPSYVKKAETVFDAQARAINFGNTQEAANLINQWVEEKTNKMIDKLVSPDSLSADCSLVLANALYFEAKWENSFDKRATHQTTFISPKGQQKIDMMYRKGQTLYFKDKGIHGVRLPYTDGRCEMIVFMPEEAGNDCGMAALDQAIATLDERLPNWQGERVDVELFLPKTDISTGFNLIPALQKCGIVNAFVAGKADLSGINGQRNLYVGFATHKARLQMDETSTKAAAATAMGVMRMAYIPGETFRANRPFAVVIRDHKTGLILFLGRINSLEK